MSPPAPSEEIDYEALPSDLPLVAHLSAGAFAGIMEHTLMFPIDLVKTRAQVLRENRGLWRSLTATAATEGPLLLWRGVGSVVAGAGPAHALYFAVFEALKTFLVNQTQDENRLFVEDRHPWIASVSGMAGTTALDAVMTPFDVVKQRMQLTTSGSMFRTIGRLFRSEGLAGFYVSYPTTLLMNIPFAGLNFGIYEAVADYLNPQGVYNPMVHCVAGGAAGAIAAGVTTPLDCVKTVLQTRGETGATATGFVSAAKHIVRCTGWNGFAKGLTARVVFNIPSTAISWTAYEMAKKYMLGA